MERNRLRNVLNVSQRRANKNSLTWWYILKTSWRVVYIAATLHPNSLIPFFTSKNTFFTSNNVILTQPHINIFFTLFNQKNPLKIGIQGNNLHIFLWNLKIWIFKNFFFRNLKIVKFGMPKKTPPKSQAKNKTLFLQYPFLTIF